MNSSLLVDVMVTTLGQLRAEIDEAGRLIAPLWPLAMGVAMNPLVGLADAPFDAAVGELARWLPLQTLAATENTLTTSRDHRAQVRPMGSHGLEEAFDRDIARWCLGLTTGGIALEGEEGLLDAWRRLYRVDRVTRRLLGAEALAVITSLPTDHEALLLALIRQVDFDATDRVMLFRSLLVRLPGWAGHAKFQELNRAIAPWYPPLRLADLVTLQLLYRVATGRLDLLPDQQPTLVETKEAARVGEITTDREDQRSSLSAVLVGAELAYRDRLLDQLRPCDTPRAISTAQVQFLLCMDTRSDRMRRRLEQVDGYETYGVAGFFGVPLRIVTPDGLPIRDLAPPLAQPLFELQADLAAVGIDDDAWSLGDPVKAVKEVGVAPYLGAEVGGLLAGFDALRRTLGGHRSLHQDEAQDALVRLECQVHASLGECSTAELDALAISLGAMLTTLGLSQHLAPLVVLVGHRAVSTNNAFGASLQCGACGGSRGTLNAIVAAILLNATPIRTRLSAQGIHLPSSTRFLAGEHITTTDSIGLVGTSSEADAEHPQLAALVETLERLSREAGSRSRRRRSRDWSEVRPEMGLIHNAALVIGDRSLTSHADLAGRVFLHSYHADADADGSLLADILLGPMVVAHWINMSYLFSSLEPDILGAGDKVLHNIVGRFGVLEGNGWDLRVGLPVQSVVDGDGHRHAPLRLLVVVDADTMVLDRVLGQHQQLGDLVDGGWVRMVGRSASDGWVERSMSGDWMRLRHEQSRA
ncbi:MAG: putative inorganic carbon transporter subunit DabA [Ferrimicrobium sp.]